MRNSRNLESLTHWIIFGADLRVVRSANNERNVDAMCDDFINKASHGNIKTSKHMSLGFTIKNITSSRRVVEMLIEFCYCSSYNASD